MLHQKADAIAAPTASKALVDFFCRRNCEGGCLFIVKRAEAEVINATLFQFYKTADNVNNVYSAKYLLYGSLRNHPSNKYMNRSPELEKCE